MSNAESGQQRRSDTGVPATLASLFLAAMRKHDRKAALLHRDGARWRDTPDWRLERQVIRLALFLRERGALGGRILIVSRLRPELALAELAAVAQGAASIVVDPDEPGPYPTSGAAAVFVADAALRGRIAEEARAVVCFDGPVEGGTAFSAALDLGGTLDTPERAQAFRAAARAVAPEAPALGWLVASDGASRWDLITQREAMATVRSEWSASPPQKDAVAYLSGPATLTARLGIIAGVSDGRTTCALGPADPEREAADIAELSPRRILSLSSKQQRP
jgi:hypothetical protein